MKNMINIICKSAIATQTRSRDQGFVLPIVIGLGIAMILVTATIMARSQVDRQNNEAQQTKAQSKGIVDAAISRAVNILNNNRIIATSSSLCSTVDPKKNYTNTGSTVCWNTIDPKVSNSIIPIQKYTRICQNNAWSDQRTSIKNLLTEQAIDSNNPAKGTYKLNSYTYAVEWKDDPDIAGDGTPSTNPKLGTTAEQPITGAIRKSVYGTLDLTTKVNYAPTTSPTDTQTRLQELKGSQIRIQFKIPITPASTSDPIPGLWITTGDMTVGTKTGNNTNLAASQVWLSDCAGGDTALNQITANVIGAKESDQLPTNEPPVTLLRPYVKFTPLSIPSSANALTSLTTPNKAQTVTTITTLFTTAGGKTSTDNQFVNISNRSSTAQTGKLIDITTKPTTGGTSGSCPLATNAYTLPKGGDQALDTDLDGDGKVDGVNFYDYIVSSLNGQTLTIPPGCKVRLYILNGIDKTSTIIHNCPLNSTNCSPSDLQIYGLGTSSKTFCFNDPKGTNNILDAFIFAPSNPVGITNSVVRGAIWASTWGRITGCSSSTAPKTLLIQKSIKWTDLPKNLRPDPTYNLENVLPPKIGGDSGKPTGWTICQTDTTYKCDGSSYLK